MDLQPQIRIHSKNISGSGTSTELACEYVQWGEQRLQSDGVVFFGELLMNAA